MDTTRAGVADGSGVQDDFSGFDGRTLLIDTASTVDEKRTPDVRTYRLTRSPGHELPADVPPSYVSEHRDGCGLNSANGYVVARASDGLKRAVENHIGEADLVFIAVSANGGTGNGSWPIIEETLTEMSPQNKRVYWIHHFAMINRQKLYTRLSDLRRKLAVGVHVLLKKLETARAVLALHRHESDAVEEIVKNVKATRGDGSFEMIQPVDIDEDTFVGDIATDIFTHCSRLWNSGDDCLDPQEVQRIRTEVQNNLRDYQRLGEESLGRISTALASCATEDDVTRMGRLLIRERHLAALREADAILSRISASVQEAGLKEWAIF